MVAIQFSGLVHLGSSMRSPYSIIRCPFLDNFYYMQRLCVLRLVDEYLSELFMYLHAYLSLYLHFIVEHALDK